MPSSSAPCRFAHRSQWCRSDRAGASAWGTWSPGRRCQLSAAPPSPTSHSSSPLLLPFRPRSFSCCSPVLHYLVFWTPFIRPICVFQSHVLPVSETVSLSHHSCSVTVFFPAVSVTLFRAPVLPFLNWLTFPCALFWSNGSFRIFSMQGLMVIYWGQVDLIIIAKVYSQRQGERATTATPTIWTNTLIQRESNQIESKRRYSQVVCRFFLVWDSSSEY